MKRENNEYDLTKERNENRKKGKKERIKVVNGEERKNE